MVAEFGADGLKVVNQRQRTQLHVALQSRTVRTIAESLNLDRDLAAIENTLNV